VVARAYVDGAVLREDVRTAATRVRASTVAELLAVG
jgi:hypothetical protein